MLLPRRPGIVDRKDYARWHDLGTPGGGVADLLKPSDPDEMEARPISTKVNSVKNDGSELLDGD